MKREWKPLIYKGILYENYELSNYGEIKNKITNKILKNRPSNKNMKMNNMPCLICHIGMGKKSKSKAIIIHRAVAENFLENKNNYQFVIFKDNNPNNVCANNLYWSKYKYGELYHKKSKCNAQLVSERRRKLKLMSVEYKGGKCLICGYNRCLAALEFHHTDPSEKDFGISARGFSRSWERIKKELDKCICVCSNCHKEIHEGLISLEDFSMF